MIQQVRLSLSSIQLLLLGQVLYENGELRYIHFPFWLIVDDKEEGLYTVCSFDMLPEQLKNRIIDRRNNLTEKQRDMEINSMHTLVRDLAHLKELAKDKVTYFFTLTPGGLHGIDIIIKYYSEENKFNVKYETNDKREFIKVSPKELAEQTQLKNQIEKQQLYVY